MLKKIPLGIMNYRELRENYYYAVDKTEFIKDFLDKGAKVTLITRPSRFGKTLNISMLAEFLDITKDARHLFEDTSIIQTVYKKEMNQHPVIFLSFLNAKGDKSNVVKYIKEELSREYNKYTYVFQDLNMF